MEKEREALLTAKVPVEAFLRTCVDVEKFLALCSACPNYGKIWACPPLSFDPMELWKSFRSLNLYARIIRPEPGMDFPEFLALFEREKGKLTEAVLELEKNIPGSLCLTASTCSECRPCLRASGKPCCHSEQLRYSIEALGGDVGKTMETYLHIPIKWASAGALPEYMTVAAGLLTKE